MSEQPNGLQGIELVCQSTSRLDEVLLLEQPSSFQPKKRKSKILTNRKTNEDLIMQSHQELMRYVDNVDSKVQNIIQTHQIQFLAAYRLHMKRVREQMEMIKKQNTKNAQSQKLYLQTIDNLQKELKIFREQSLKLFEKIALKDKQISDLNIRIRQFLSENNQSQKTITFLTKRNKELEANIEKMKQKWTQLNKNNLGLIQGGDIKPKQLSSLMSKHISQDKDRPFTSAYSIKNKTLSLRLQSNQKMHQNMELAEIRQKLQQKVGPSKTVSIDTVIQMLSHSPSRFGVGKEPREKLYEKISKRRASSFRITENEGLKLKSQQLAQKTDYLNIFKSCVQDLKKDIIRRNNIPSINFFKENGPKNFIQFKKVEKYLLVELFLKSEQVLKKFYQLLFTNIQST